MHNRDMIWTTAGGKKNKISDLTSDHLVNIEKHIEENRNQFLTMLGEQRLETCLFNIRQEIRLRKLNRLELDSEEENLF